MDSAELTGTNNKLSEFQTVPHGPAQSGVRCMGGTEKLFL